MSPEAQKPQPQVDSKFIEGHHPTDNVRPFKQGDLADVHDSLLERGIPEASQINPDTLEVAVDKVALAPEKKTPSWKKWIAGLVGGAVLAGGGYGAAKFGESDRTLETTTPTPNASAPAVAGETATTAPEQSKNTVDISRVAGEPTPEQIQAAMTYNLSVAEYPTAADVAVVIGDISNIYGKSGITEWQGDTVVFTPETKEQGMAILENLYGPYLTPEEVEGREAFRTDWSMAIRTDPYPELMAYFEPDESTMQDLGGGKWSIEVNEMHDDSYPNNMNHGTDFRELMTLQNDGERWYLVSYETLSQLS